MKTETTKLDEELTKPLVQDEEDLSWEPVKPTSSARPRPVKGGMSCCCKCVLITFGLLFALGAIMMVAAYNFTADIVEHLTVTTPHDKFPVVDMSDEELQVVKTRVALFADQLLAGTAKEPLTVTEHEINGFIGHSDFLRGNMYVTLKDGAIEEEYSLPTEMLPGGKGRYFVGNEYVKVQDDVIELKSETAATHHDWFDGPLLFAQLQYLVSGENLLELYLKKGSFFGQEAPQEFIDQHQNLLEDFYNDPDAEDARTIMKGIELVSIESGKIVVVPRNH